METILRDLMGQRTAKAGFLEWFLPIYSVIIYYKFPLVGSYGQVILFAYAIPCILIRRRIAFYFPKWLILFTLFVFPVQMIVFRQVGGLTSSRVVNLIMILVYLVLLGLFRIDIDGLMVMYKIVAVIASILIIVQFIQINLFGKIVHQITFFYERSELWYQKGTRPQGIFPEPQVYATFILPLLILCLQKGQYVWATFLTISVIFSTSSLGILCSFGIWFYYFIFSSLSIRKSIFVLGAVTAFLVGILTIPAFSYAVNKILQTDYLQNARLTRGFAIYGKLPLFNKLFGIGVNNLAYYIESGMIRLNDALSRGMINKSYVTTVADLLIHYGLIATLLYGAMLFNLFRNSNIRLMVIVLFVLSFGQTILFSGVWFYFLIIILSTLKGKNNVFFRFTILKS